ncbi:hypothetical protein AB434_2040 [Heyndrickxia coagulans]|uniref:Uncharacterized protein n=1 Tax=Heyndrickxia coagulans TaxID=1398 RepID=A0AAN0WCX1_HEYCO|nr:hypothetical protein SB48_HM08orf05251 [Heyndrickxia coagulans]AKN54445.1 hypothetical protein AB434_2040 [Heyndrickxia coagulans]
MLINWVENRIRPASFIYGMAYNGAMQHLQTAFFPLYYYKAVKRPFF